MLLPRSAFCFVEPPDDQAKLCTVSTTRVWFWWALLMRFVRAALVQPVQPARGLLELPVADAPTPK